MSSVLYNNLSDNFTNPDGSLSGYLLGTGFELVPHQHYDLRTFNTTNQTTPWTMNDMSLWNVYFFAGMLMQNMETRSVSGRTSRGRMMSEIDGLRMQAMDILTMQDLDSVTVSAGNEEWPVGDPTIIVGQDPAYRYSYSLAVTPLNTTKTITSFYNDDIFTDFQDANVNYYIEMILRNFPAQTAAAHLNLSLSFIDISSSTTFDPTSTDSIPFIASIQDVSTGGDTFLKFPRSLLVNCDMTDIQAIRFRLTSTGSMTFKVQALRLTSSAGKFNVINTNTKSTTLTRYLPEAGFPETATPFGTLYFDTTQPKNLKQIVQFNSGHSPVSPNANILRLFYRYDLLTGYFVEVIMTANTAGFTVTVSENVGGILTQKSTHSYSALDTDRDYYAIIEVIDNTIEISFDWVRGVFYGGSHSGAPAVIPGTSTTTLTEICRGLVGYSFEPYNYDFAVDSISVERAEFAEFRSTPFLARTNIAGAQLQANFSTPVDLTQGMDVNADGDSVITRLPNEVIEVDRSGLFWYGGVRSHESIAVGDSSQVVASGEIFPINSSSSQFVIALVNISNSVYWLRNITGTLSNQWNSFNFPLPLEIIPAEHYLLLHSIGFTPTETKYRLRNITLEHNTIDWQMSATGGSWYSISPEAINNPFGGVYLPRPDTGGDVNDPISIQVQATALSDTAWIANYIAEPLYRTYELFP